MHTIRLILAVVVALLIALLMTGYEQLNSMVDVLMGDDD